jgi:hypothetical protein
MEKNENSGTIVGTLHSDNTPYSNKNQGSLLRRARKTAGSPVINNFGLHKLKFTQ